MLRNSTVTNAHSSIAINRQRVNIALARHGLTIGDVARRLGCTPHCLSQVLAGKRPRSQYLARFCAEVGLTVREIMIGPARPRRAA